MASGTVKSYTIPSGHYSGGEGAHWSFEWTSTQKSALVSTVSWNLYTRGRYRPPIQLVTGCWLSVTKNGSVTQLYSGNGFSGSNSSFNDEWRASGSFDVTHNPDGTGSFVINFEVYIYEYAHKNTSRTCSLDTFPTQSTPTTSSSSVQLGTPITIYTHRASPSFTHTLEFRFGNASEVIAQNVQDTADWYPSLELASQIPNALSGTAVISCTTYAGGVSLGTKEVSVTLTTPPDLVPSVSMCWEDLSGGLTSLGVCVQGITRVGVAVEGTGVYGSTIAGKSVTLNDKLYHGGTITDFGELLLVGSVIDSRGRVGYTQDTLYVAPYNPPHLTLNASRCTAEGEADDTGDHAKITINGYVTQVNDRNTGTLTLSWGEETETLSLGVGEVSYQKIIYADPNTTMPITAALADKLVSASRTMILSSGYATLDLLAGGRGISFGKAATREGFDCAMPAFFSAGLYATHPDGTTDENSLFDRVAALEAALLSKL